jgi:uncharacterized phage protein gp47/JayE
MALTLSQLLTAKTREEMISLMLAELQAKGFPTTAWIVGGIIRTVVEVLAKLLEDFSKMLVIITEGGLLEYATGDWLTLLCRSNFNTVRKEATFAEWDVTLSCSASAGPYTITAGQLWASTAAGRLFNNKAGGTLNASGTLILRFKAESPGVLYNAGPVNILKTTLPGVTISASSLVSSAADQETDPQLRERALLQWALLALGATAATYLKWALDSDVDVRRAFVEQNNPNPGQVKVWIARQDTTATGGDETTVGTYLADPFRKVICVTPIVTKANNNNVSITGTALINATDLDAAQAAIGDKLLELFRSFPIGDGNATTSKLYKSELVEVFMALPGMKNFILATPAADVALAVGDVAVLSGFDPESSITWNTF